MLQLLGVLVQSMWSTLFEMADREWTRPKDDVTDQKHLTNLPCNAVCLSFQYQEIPYLWEEVVDVLAQN